MLWIVTLVSAPLQLQPHGAIEMRLLLLLGRTSGQSFWEGYLLKEHFRVSYSGDIIFLLWCIDSLQCHRNHQNKHLYNRSCCLCGKDAVAQDHFHQDGPGQRSYYTYCQLVNSTAAAAAAAAIFVSSLTGQFSRDHSRLCQVYKRPPKENCKGLDQYIM